MSSDIVKSFGVATTLASQRIVCNLTATAQAVKYPAGVLEQPIGSSTDTVLDTTGSIPICVSGIAKLLFNDTVVSGAYVVADSSGRGVPFVDDTLGVSYVGILLGAKVDVTGTIAEVLIMPGTKAIP